MFDCNSRKPLLVSDEARDCVLTIIEKDSLSAYVQEAKEEMAIANPRLFCLVENAGKIICSYASRQNNLEIAETLQAAFCVGSYTAYLAFSFETTDVPFVDHGVLEHVIGRQQYDAKLRAHRLWLLSLGGDENLTQVMHASGLLSPQQPVDVIDQMKAGAGCVSNVLNNAVAILN